MEQAGSFLDVKGFLAQLAATGATVEMDGWTPRVTGTRPPPEQMKLLLLNKLPIVYHLASVAPHRCESCGGVGTTVFEWERDLHWFCSGHVPTSDGRFLLWEAAKQKDIYTREIDRLHASQDPRRELIRSFEAKRDHWSEEYDALEAQLSLT